MSEDPPLWSGRDTRALREARRMSVREFAAHLGVSDRMISKWEAAGVHIHPRPLNQSALDTSLSLADRKVRDRFNRFREDVNRAERGRQPAALPLTTGSDAGNTVRHPIDGKHMIKFDSGPYRRRYNTPPIWLPGYYIDLHPVTVAAFARFKAMTEWPSEHPAAVWSLTNEEPEPDPNDRDAGQRHQPDRRHRLRTLGWQTPPHRRRMGPCAQRRRDRTERCASPKRAQPEEAPKAPDAAPSAAPHRPPTCSA